MNAKTGGSMFEDISCAQFSQPKFRGYVKVSFVDSLSVRVPVC